MFGMSWSLTAFTFLSVKLVGTNCFSKDSSSTFFLFFFFFQATPDNANSLLLCLYSGITPVGLRSYGMSGIKLGAPHARQALCPLYCHSTSSFIFFYAVLQRGLSSYIANGYFDHGDFCHDGSSTKSNILVCFNSHQSSIIHIYTQINQCVLQLFWDTNNLGTQAYF